MNNLEDIENITHKKGDILTEKVEALVNPVNCVGVMGKGLALQFKKAFPENYQQHKLACNNQEVEPGKMFVTQTTNLLPKYIINFPTKRHWRAKSKIEDIDSSLIALINRVQILGIKSIAIPPLGCGNGGLNWEVVQPKIIDAFKNMPDLKVVIFEP